MKAVVCFKVIPDYSRLSGEDWIWDERNYVDIGFVRRIFNCFDESALEMLLKLSQNPEIDSDIEIKALTIDDEKSELFLKHLIAVGYDAVHIQPDKTIDFRFNPLAVSNLLAGYIKKTDQQLVLLGQQGGEGDNRQTGMLVAERLGWPFISEVTEIKWSETKKYLTVTSRIDGNTLVQSIKLPIVLSIGQSIESSHLRIPSLKQKLAAKKKKITTLTSLDLGIGADIGFKNDKTLIHLQRPESNASCVFLENENLQELARSLYNDYIKERL
ncbi:MAG: hypothetical protein HOD92_20790 [Deltaproteobacteria bacterium]|nr:hypothetical protein [Deltaproteobacteria bacterium]